MFQLGIRESSIMRISFCWCAGAASDQDSFEDGIAEGEKIVERELDEDVRRLHKNGKKRVKEFKKSSWGFGNSDPAGSPHHIISIIVSILFD